MYVHVYVYVYVHVYVYVYICMCPPVCACASHAHAMPLVPLHPVACRFDANGNGKLEEGEFQTLIASMFKQSGSDPAAAANAIAATEYAPLRTSCSRSRIESCSVCQGVAWEEMGPRAARPVRSWFEFSCLRASLVSTCIGWCVCVCVCVCVCYLETWAILMQES
jgi:hypothetical protein